MCVCVCPHYNLKTIAGICFLLGSYIDWRKILDELEVCTNLNFKARPSPVHLSAALLDLSLQSPLTSGPSPTHLLPAGGFTILRLVHVCSTPLTN